MSKSEDLTTEELKDNLVDVWKIYCNANGRGTCSPRVHEARYIVKVLRDRNEWHPLMSDPQLQSPSN